MLKYGKGKKKLDLCMLQLRSHIRRADYVATMFNSANMLQMGLVSPFGYG